MPMTIPDDVLREAGLSEREALIEFACRLYDAGRLSMRAAAGVAGLDRAEFEDALLERGLPVYRVSEKDLQRDMETLRKLDSGE